MLLQSDWLVVLHIAHLSFAILAKPVRGPVVFTKIKEKKIEEEEEKLLHCLDSMWL